MSLSKKCLCVFLSLFCIFQTVKAESDLTQSANSKWLMRALALQRQIDLNAPIIQATFIGTHNSYNSESYRIPFIRYIDPNHTLSVYEQLEAGARSIELDAHWYQGRYGKKDILLCHGRPNHLGCSMFDRPFREGLLELREWMKAHPQEILLIYIERHLDGHESQFGRVDAAANHF